MMRPRSLRRNPVFWHYAIVLCLGACFAVAFRTTIPKTGVINDEAVELLQAQDLPLDRLYVFTPNYRGGNADLIESLTSYVSFGLWKLFGTNLWPMHGFYALSYCAAAVLCFALLRQVYREAGLRVGGAVLFCGSSYALFFTRIITRNALSLLWSTLLLLILRHIVDTTSRPPKTALLAWLPVALTCALWTYSSFKFVAVAVYMALLAHWLRLPRYRVEKMATGGYLLGSVSVFVGLVSGLLFLGGTSVSVFLFRGSYVLQGGLGVAARRYVMHLARSLMLPVLYLPGGDFLMDVTHTAYARQMLSWLLAPLFFLGIWRLLRTWRRAWGVPHLALAIWLLATLPLALGGPHLKHHFALFPCVFLVAMQGMQAVYQWGRRHVRENAVFVLTGVFCVGVVAGEVRHLAGTIPANPLLILDTRLPAAFARHALALAARQPKVYIVEGYGRDATRYYTRHVPTIGYIWNHAPVSDAMRADLARDQAIGIVTQGRAEPPCIAQIPDGCVETLTERVDRWEMTTYLVTGGARCAPLPE